MGNNGDGTFGPINGFSAQPHPANVAIGDLNADAKPDLVAACNKFGVVSVLLGNGDGTFAPETHIPRAAIHPRCGSRTGAADWRCLGDPGLLVMR